MVGRLVEEQDVGLGRERAGERRAAALAAGEARRVFLAGEAEGFEEIARAVRIVARRQPGLDEGSGGREAGEVRLLRQVADGHRRLEEAAAAVGLDQPGGDLEERRLARAVAPDQAQALARADRQLGAVEQRRAAEGQAMSWRRRSGGAMARVRQRYWLIAWRW